MMLFRILATLVAMLLLNGAVTATNAAIGHELDDSGLDNVELRGAFAMSLTDTSPPTMVLPISFTTTGSFSTEITLSPATTTTEPIGQQSADVEIVEAKVPMSLRSTHPPTKPTTFKAKGSVSTVVTLSPVTTTTAPIGQQPATTSA